MIDLLISEAKTLGNLKGNSEGKTKLLLMYTWSLIYYRNHIYFETKGNQEIKISNQIGELPCRYETKKRYDRLKNDEEGWSKVDDPIEAWTDEADSTERLGSPDDAASSSRRSAAQMCWNDL